MKENPFLPQKVRIIDIREEVKGGRAIKTLRVDLLNENNLEYKPGQGCLISVFGKGESWLCIANSPTRENLEFSVLKMGRVTTALHQMSEGEVLGLRGPLGNSFPLEEWAGKDIIAIGGGIGQTPLRAVSQYILDKHEKYGKLTIFHGARTSKDIVYKDELEKLLEKDNIDVYLSIDKEEKGWDHFVGFVPDNVRDKKPETENSITITCGPPIMIKTTFQALKDLGFKDRQMYTTLERKMKCGIGKCGRCNIGAKYVCKNGPVFRCDELRKLPVDY